MRLALLPAIRMPQPRVQDEFSYLLAAQTFASGRLTNPPHRMGVHFETFHEIFWPTYNSKYFPGQGLFLALGWKVFGHPWYGVWLSFGLYCACLCWMLQGWLPPVYALLATLVNLGQITIFDYWMNSYWGGAVAAAAGCLVLGALPRLARGGKSVYAAMFALGLVLLANTRPYEGLVLSLAATGALAFWRHKLHYPGRLFSFRNCIAFLAISASGAIWTGYYNFRVTGNALVFPYTVYDETYLIAPQLAILPEKPVPTYHHKVIESYFKDVELAHYRKVRSNPLRNSEIITAALPFYCSTLMMFAALIGVFFSRSIKLQLVAAIGACLCVAVSLELHLIPHYLAAGVGLIPILVGYGLRCLRVQARAFGTAIVLLLVLIAFMSSFTQLPALLRASITPTPREIATSLVLKHDKGKHLILVRYAPSHFVHNEYVYNAADIDAAPIVWARDMGDQANQELLNYYRDRKVWLWQPDITPDAITRYQPATAPPGHEAVGR